MEQNSNGCIHVFGFDLFNCNNISLGVAFTPEVDLAAENRKHPQSRLHSSLIAKIQCAFQHINHLPLNQVQF